MEQVARETGGVSLAGRVASGAERISVIHSMGAIPKISSVGPICYALLISKRTKKLPVHGRFLFLHFLSH